MSAPDLRHVETWVFDLDNTLYPAELDLFAQVDQRMGEYISRLLDVPLDDARVLQKRYYAEHGTTLTGLVRLHGIEPAAFLDYVHDIDMSAVKPSAELDRLLAELDGRKIVFTNGSIAHAERVLAALDIGHHFREIYDIAAFGFVPKHEEAAFGKLVAQADFRPRRAAMFDDVARNLRPAHALGMTTVWIRTMRDWSVPKEFLSREEADAASYIDHEAGDLVGFLRAMRHKAMPTAASAGAR